MKQLFISKNLIENTDCSFFENELLKENGCISDKEQRHQLHIIIGRIGNYLCNDLFGKNCKEIQQLISNQEILPLLESGILEMLTKKDYYQCFLQNNNSSKYYKIINLQSFLEQFSLKNTKITKNERQNFVESLINYLLQKGYFGQQ